MTSASTIEPRPAISRLYWSAYADFEGDSSPADPLRFDMYTQRLGNVLAPGITNRTERLRYLSMVCAGLLETHRGGTSVREGRRAFLPFERGWALAMTAAVDGRIKLGGDDGAGGRGLRPAFQGLRGANRVLRHYRTLVGATKIKPADYVLLQGQDSQGGLGAYLVTLREFGFVHPDSLGLTARGRELADAFAPKRKHVIRLGMLGQTGPVERRYLERLGESLTLSRPTQTEVAIVKDAIFDSSRSVVGEVLRRIAVAHPGAHSPRDGLASVANADGDHLERAAAYAVTFDPMRIAALAVFASLGKRLVPVNGAAALATLMTEQMEDGLATLRAHAAKLRELPVPEGLGPVDGLARDLVAATDAETSVRALISYHRREERSWIVAEGKDRYRLGSHGPFDPPRDDFNGYTIGRAFQLHADLDLAA